MRLEDCHTGIYMCIGVFTWRLLGIPLDLALHPDREIDLGVLLCYAGLSTWVVGELSWHFECGGMLMHGMVRCYMELGGLLLLIGNFFMYALARRTRVQWILSHTWITVNK